MSDGEIVHSYRLARDQEKQINVLAELNDCPRDEIRYILKNAGCNPRSEKMQKKERKKYRPITPEDDANIMRLARSGANYREIGDAIGRAPQTVGARLRILKKKGIYKKDETGNY